jgi:hypothetical protein
MGPSNLPTLHQQKSKEQNGMGPRNQESQDEGKDAGDCKLAGRSFDDSNAHEEIGLNLQVEHPSLCSLFL